MDVSGTPAGGLLDPTVSSQDTNVAQLVAHFYYVLNSSVSVNYCCVAALVWAVYDQLLTLGDEIDYIWSRPSRATDPIYFLTRYAGLASLAITFASYVWPDTTDLFSVATSTTSQYINVQTSWIAKFAPALDFALLWIVEVILQLRVHALYGSPRLAALNIFIFAMEVVLMLSLWLGWPILCSPLIFFGLFDDGSGDLGGTLTSSDDGGNHLFLSIANWDSACPNGSQGAIVPLYWIPAIIYELWLVGLALAKLRPRLRKHDIITPLVNDSIMYFVIIAVVMGAHLAMSTHRPFLAYSPMESLLWSPVRQSGALVSCSTYAAYICAVWTSQSSGVPGRQKVPVT
ncbi:hypothetical protein EXIGLDRAFT_236582 [Exidia glandulosa HHB12029]|uniref:DUF6533 domain-containing protein n=1 Tax=Exidia glandulosa HHB12029 TaxID=1314781 RepID=A0A165E0Y0_EXIGL|nr:hypothetical protein EXIGLDRAFT_236582 [Exidia glandulosa HHB12029]